MFFFRSTPPMLTQTHRRGQVWCSPPAQLSYVVSFSQLESRILNFNLAVELPMVISSNQFTNTKSEYEYGARFVDLDEMNFRKRLKF